MDFTTAATDLIARLYPHGDFKQDTLQSIQTSPLYVSPVAQPPKPRPAYCRGERQPTEPPEESCVPEPSPRPYLELRFSHIPRSHHGIVFGTDPDSDVVLPNWTGIGYRHFTLTFDEAHRPIVKDWGSLIGTEVTYDGHGRGKRSKFQWIVGGNPRLKHVEEILINLDPNDRVQFQIVTGYHNVSSPEYIDKVGRFHKGTASAEGLFNDLSIPNRPETEWPTGTHTPRTGAIHLRKRVGEGAYGVVDYFWNVSTGEEHALKKPSEKARRKGMVNVDAWRHEAFIMGLVSRPPHPHLVTLFHAVFEPYPQLTLEYVPGGSLEDQEDVTAAECVSIVCQCTSALTYLHGHNPPIVHRDIKPGNILIQERHLGYIHVKFGDFGLSKDYDNLSTICGSWRYLAPEMYQNRQYIGAGGNHRVTYTAAVDVWSLGVVVYELLCRLPPYRQIYESSGTVWCEMITKTFREDLEKGPDLLRRFLLEAMVVLQPTIRWSAQDCHTQAELLATTRLRSETRRTASYAGEDEKTTILHQSERSIADSKQTVIRGPISYNRAGASSQANEPFSPSSAPKPTSTQKRPTAVSGSSSSSSEKQNSKRQDHRSRGIESTSRQQLEPLRRHTQERLLRDPWRKGGVGEDFVESSMTEHLPRPAMGLGVNSSLADHAQGPLFSRLSGGWEQDCNVTSDYLPDQLTPRMKPGNDGLGQCRQTDNVRDGLEAADAELLLQVYSRQAHGGSRIGHTPSEWGPLSRPSPSAINLIPRTGSLQSDNRRSQKDMENASDAWRETPRYHAQLSTSIQKPSHPIQSRRVQPSRSSPSPRRKDRSRSKPTLGQHSESESEVEYYENCWLDPLHLLGGGSSLTISGRPADNLRASTLTSESQNLVEPVDGQDLMTQPSDVTSPRQHPATGAESIPSWTRRGSVQGDGTNSELFLASAGLQTIHDDKSDSSRSNAPSHQDGRAADGEHSTDDRDSLDDDPDDRADHPFQQRVPTVVEQGEGARSSALASGGRRGPMQRKRTSAQDRETLEAAYSRNPAPGRGAYLDLVQRVSMNEGQLRIWFQNRRQADRKKRVPYFPVLLGS